MDMPTAEELENLTGEELKRIWIKYIRENKYNAEQAKCIYLAQSLKELRDIRNLLKQNNLMQAANKLEWE